MKQITLVLGLTLVLLLLGLSGISGATGDDRQSNQNDARTAKRSAVAYDIYGKRLRRGEEYIASRKLNNGRIIAYRKNKREVAALVRLLKEAGITDKKLLDPQTWLMSNCLKFWGNPMCYNNCGLGNPCIPTSTPADKIKPTLSHPLDFCGCSH